MTMKNKLLIFAIPLSIVAAFAFGRYSVKPSPGETTTETQTESQTEKDKNTHKETEITKIKDKDGKETTVTKIVEDSNSTSKKNTETIAKTDTVVKEASTLNISLMGGVDLNDGRKEVYGAIITKQVWGPTTLGIFGLSNGIVGATVGLNF